MRRGDRPNALVDLYGKRGSNSHITAQDSCRVSSISSHSLGSLPLPMDLSLVEPPGFCRALK